MVLVPKSSPPAALHRPGKGSFYQYRRGCRCPECEAARADETVRRSLQRQASKPKASVSKKTTTGRTAKKSAGFEAAARAYLESAPESALTTMYGELLILVAAELTTAEPKDKPKLVEQMVDLAKLMQPAGNGNQGNDPFFAGLGQPRDA